MARAPPVFGFQVRCRERLRFLRAGAGVETLDVVTASEPRRRPAVPPIADWPLGGANQEARGTLYRVERGFEFWATDVGAYHVDVEQGRIEIPETPDHVGREQRLWGMPAVLCYMQRGDIPLHAAAVELGAGAVILAAPSHYGKTTLALAFHGHGYRVLSEDLACCRVSSVPELLPGPALMRIRTDVYAGCPPSGTHVVASRPDRVFLALDDDRRGSSAPVPIRGIVMLLESTDGVKMERAASPVALADLWALSFRLPTNEARSRAFKQLARLAGAVPTWNLYRPLRLGSLDAVVAYVAERIDRHRG